MSDIDLPPIIEQFERNKHVISNHLKDQGQEVHTWKPSPEKWNLLQIVCHLIDEEKEDFRARVKHCLESPNDPMPPIDPVGWVEGRKYMEQNYHQKVEEWIKEREYSIQYLKSLKNPNWSNTYQHPKRGPMTARLFLMNWLAHDYHHIRQINNTLYAYHSKTCGEKLNYAGDW